MQWTPVNICRILHKFIRILHSEVAPSQWQNRLATGWIVRKSETLTAGVQPPPIRH
jgi:hypothetical protein